MAEPWTPTAKEYHAARDDEGRPVLGASQLLAFSKDRRKFFQENIARDRVQREMTEALAVGQIMHARILEDQKDFEASTFKTRCKKHRALEVEACADLHTVNEVSEGLRLAESFLDPGVCDTPAANDARHILNLATTKDYGDTEHAYKWTEDGVIWWKYMADIVLSEYFEVAGEPWDLIVDLKSFRKELDELSWRREVKDRKYHLKAAHYVRGRQYETGRKSVFAHIVIGKTDPDIAIYQIRDDDENGYPMREGAEQVEEIRAGITDALASNDPAVWLNPHQRGARQLKWYT